MAFAEQESKGDNLSFGLYRAARLIDTATVTVFNYMMVGGMMCMLAGIIMFATSYKTNLPKSYAWSLIFIGFILGSPRGCMEMNARTFLNTSEVQAVDVKSDDSIRMNEDLY